MTDNNHQSGEYDVETEPVVGWAIVRDPDAGEIWPEPITAPATDPARAVTPFEEVALAIADGEELVETFPDTTGATVKLAWIEDDRGELLEELGYHYEDATNPDWQEVAAAIDDGG